MNTLSSIPVEAMGYLIDGFSISDRSDSRNGTRIKMKLLFIVSKWENDEDFDEQCPCQIVTVQVPKGCPIYRVRGLINHIEKQLRGLYKDAKRLNFVLIAKENTDHWRTELDLPTYDVVYV